jgi:hypothetical protein
MPLTPEDVMIEGRCCCVILEVDGRVLGSCEYAYEHTSRQHRFRTQGTAYGIGAVIVDVRWHSDKTTPRND